MKHRTLQLTASLFGGLVLTVALALLIGQATSVRADPDVRYVAPGGDCNGSAPCYASLQAAVDAAAAGDEIRVAAGTYTGVSTRGGVTQLVYVDKSVSIRGGYTTDDWTTPDPDANPTTLDAQGQGRVLYVTGDINPTIEGFRVTGGDASGLGGGPYQDRDSGGGLYILTATARARKNHIFGNTAERGGGLFLYRSGATLTNNTVTSNTAHWGGGLNLINSGATLGQNTVATNAAVYNGAGLFLDSSDAKLSQNVIRFNSADSSGGGLFLGSSDANLDGNLFVSNTTDGSGGGLMTYNSAPLLTNNVVADNHATAAGSGLYVVLGSPSLLHTTISSNTGGDGSGIYIKNWGGETHSIVGLTNTILVSHSVGISVTGGNTVTVNGVLWHNTTITLLQASAANVMVQNQYQGNPAFAADGYHLTSGSAAVDRGIDAGVTTDIDGDPRPMGHGYDLGADELRIALNVTKHADPDPVAPGEQLTYTIFLVNTGDVDLNATITDTLPAHVTSSQATPLPGGASGITWTATITAPGGTWTETVVVTVAQDYGGSLSNLVEVTTEEGAMGDAIVVVNAQRIFLPLVLR